MRYAHIDRDGEREIELQRVFHHLGCPRVPSAGHVAMVVFLARVDLSSGGPRDTRPAPLL